MNAPTIGLKNQKWTVECAEELVVAGGSGQTSSTVLDRFENKADVFDVKKRKASSTAVDTRRS